MQPKLPRTLQEMLRHAAAFRAQPTPTSDMVTMGATAASVEDEVSLSSSSCGSEDGSDLGSDMSSDLDSSTSSIDFEEVNYPAEAPTKEDKKNGLFLSLEMVQLLRTSTSEGNLKSTEATQQLLNKITSTTPRRLSGGGPVKSSMVYAIQTKSSMESNLVDPGTPKPKDTLETILRSQGVEIKYTSFKNVDPKFFVAGCSTSNSFQLMTAVRNNDLSMLRFAHKHKQNLQCCNRFGETIMHVAARRGHTEVLQFLHQKAGVSVRVVCEMGRTPLHEACWTNKPDFKAIELLLQDCPDFLFVTDQRGFSPLDFIPKEAHEEWNDFLRAHPDLIKPRGLF
jgi:hypothetical protein